MYWNLIKDILLFHGVWEKLHFYNFEAIIDDPS